MRYIKITDDATRADIEDAITNLAARRRTCGLIEVQRALGDDIDDLLTLWQQAT